MWIRIAIACAVLWLHSAVARADEPPGAAQAKALTQEGVALRKEGKEREALAKFREAYALYPTPRALAQMALAEKSLRSYVEAERHLDEALADSADPWIATHREALQYAKDYVVKQLAWIDVTSNVDAAELSVNGIAVGPLPLEAPYRVVAGLTVVVVRHPGYVDAREEVTLVATAVTPLHVALDAMEKPAEPVAAPIVAPAPKPPPVEEPASYTPWIIATGAVAAVGLGVGIALGVRTLDIKAERDAICPQPYCATQDGVDLDGEARDMGNGATASFVIAGAAAVASLVLWLVEPDDAADVSSDGAQITWRF